MKRNLLFSALLLCGMTAAHAQRQMDALGRGLVAVKTNSGIYTGWRIDGSEYYDTQYNLYRDGVKVNELPLTVSNFLDKEGDVNSKYTVKAIVRGVEQEACEPVSVWNQQYLSIPMDKVLSRKGTDITSDYQLNDASAADLDGDGQFEIIVKRIYGPDGLFDVANDSAFCLFEAYKLDGTKLWTIDCGPNIISSGHVETNIVAYDWDGDGKAELLMRAADGTIIHGANGDQVIGDLNKNYRNQISHSANMTYATAGDEFLLYMEGATAKLYNQREFPLKRLEAGETDLNKAWGDGYGHRANKFFFGAPYLDGRKPSIYLGRGIYTRHKMIAYDVNPQTHELTERWRWDCNTGGAWYGQGYHNFGIADVDWDGRDEIVYGSMVIDDNGKGLSTTGLGHGDAQHCSDFDPYRKGQEIFACNENAQGANYRDATTSQIYYMHHLGRDCGRAMAGNFTDQYMGSQMVAVGMGLLSSVTSDIVSTGWSGITQNYRIYWDGDLCEESVDGAGTEGPAAIYKYGKSEAIFTATGTKMNNWTKNTPALQADILGDWREEIVVRAEDNQSLRIYTTTDVTPWWNYTLLHDMQYRQAVVWQMCGYNQPPHTSYFLGKAEGITVAPPPLMTNGRVEVTDAITAAHNGQHVLLANTDGGTVNVTDGVSPYILTVNAFSHTEGHDNNDQITTSYATYTLTGGSFSGDMRLVKQGEGILTFGGTQNYKGETMLWGGTTNFDGKLPESRVWMNRFAELNASADFGKAIEMEYGAVLRAGGNNTKGQIKADSLIMNFGAIVEFDIYADEFAADRIVLSHSLVLNSTNKSDAPQYKNPVFRFVSHTSDGKDLMPAGKYLLMDVTEIDGDLEKVDIEGLEGLRCHLESDGQHVYLVIEDLRAASTIYWNGSSDSNVWDLASTENFNMDGEAEMFVTGDKVIFDDAAQNQTVNIKEDVMPSEVVFKADKDYTLTGSGSMSGEMTLNKQGKGVLTIENQNKYTGKTLLESGTTVVTTLANDINPYGAFGAYTTEKDKLELRNGAILKNTSSVSNSTPIMLGEGGGELNCGADFEMKGGFIGESLVKSGNGTLTMLGNNQLKYTVLKSGTLSAGVDGVSFGDTLIFEGGTYRDCDNMYSYSSNANNFCVRERKTATFYTDSRCAYTGRLYGKGTFKVDIHYVRTELQGNWSAFEGTLEPVNTNYGLTFNNSYGLPKATLNLPAGATVTNTGKEFTIGKVTGSGTLGELPPFGGSGANTWKVGSLNEDFTFTATVTGNGTCFEKVGTGLMRVNSYSNFTGNCNVLEGTLCLNKLNATSSMLGTGVLTVSSGATLSGQGKLSNSTVNVSRGAVLRPGVSENSITGEIDFSSKRVSLSAGSTLQFYINSKTMYTKLTGISNLTLRGTLKVLVNENISLSAGDEIKLWDANSTTIGGTVEYDLASPGNGLEWDTSSIEDGILRVQAGTGIGMLENDVVSNFELFTVSGVKLGVVTCHCGELVNEIKKQGLGTGTYMIRMKTTNGSIVEKIQISE